MRRHILVRYLIFTVLAHLAWETAQLPLYGLWKTASPASLAFAVAHCTGGDVIIAFASLAVALILFGRAGWPAANGPPVIVAATIVGAGYTVYSEWFNTAVRGSWSYAPAMPTLPPLGTGLAPIVQWLLLPPLGLWWAMRVARGKQGPSHDR